MTTKKTPTRQDDKIKIAILETQLAAIESRMAASNAAVETQLKSINSGIKEIHDKMDMHILHQTVEVTRLKTQQEETDKNYKEKFKTQGQEIERVEAKIWKVGSIMGTVVAALITGAVELVKIK